MSILRYSVTVQFDIEAGDAATLNVKMTALEKVAQVTQIKAKSAGAGKKEAK